MLCTSLHFCFFDADYALPFIMTSAHQNMILSTLLLFIRYYKHIKQRRQRLFDLLFTSSHHADDDAAIMLLFNTHRRRRGRIWAYARSKEWMRLVLLGKNLERGELERNFRMARNSFELLHYILSTLRQL